MRKKIALMTWYKFHNYGTALQAACLYHVINKLGYDVDVINYPSKIHRNYSCNKVYRSILNAVFSKVKEIINPPVFSAERKNLYYHFLANHITETNPCRSYSELHDLEKIYDVFVCGSDQIWSPICYDEKYFLSFVDESEKMVAYAPSMGNNRIDEERLKIKITENLKRFSHLSVRENDGKKLIKQLSGQTAEVVLDPTLLLSKEQWDDFVATDNVKKEMDSEYIICYYLGNAKKYSKYVSKLSEKTGVPYYIIPVRKNQYKCKHKVPFEVGPAEFVSLIKNARYVCTDSFHGMAFSIIYNKPFTAFKRFADKAKDNQNSRLENLLDALELKDRLIKPTCKNDFPEFNQCSFEHANCVLADMRADSMAYLTSALKSAAQYVPERNSGKIKITDICCGCGACAAVCPKGAVTIQKNDEGFEQYTIQQDTCIQCGKCKTVCPMSRVEATELQESYGLYSVKNQSEHLPDASSSAGVGHAIAAYGIKNQYHICGCIYDREASAAKHILIGPDEGDKIDMLQGSKYIQSVTANVLEDIYKMQPDEKLVFFGTPCQVAAVRKLLQNKTMQNVVLVDLICHGVPSYHLWKTYIADVDKKHSTGMNPSVSFRNKSKNWHKRHIKIQGNGHIYLKSERKDDFYAFFRRGICDMNACSECPYREKTSADIRIGDYWGKKFQKSSSPVSMVIANTKTGVELLEQLKKENFMIERQELDEYWRIQAPYNLKQSLYRKEIIEALQRREKSLHKLRKRYCKYYDIFEFLEITKAKLGCLKAKILK